MKRKHLIFDTSNLVWRVASVQQGTPEEIRTLTLHITMYAINKIFKKTRPDQVAFIFEGANNWRKEFTAKTQLTKKYKANRVRTAEHEAIFEAFRTFETFLRESTNAVVISNPRLEGDDCFAAYVQYFCDKGDDVIGVSGDNDFAQLLKLPTFSLINNAMKPASLEKLCGVDDAEYFMFLKAFRGDAGDNVMNAYPRLRETKIKKAFTDEYTRNNLMNETWSLTDENGEVHEVRVGDAFNNNMTLMNLFQQPAEIRQLMVDTVEAAITAESKKFSYPKFLRFCGEYELHDIASNSEKFFDLLSCRIKQSGADVTQTATTVSAKKSVLHF